MAPATVARCPSPTLTWDDEPVVEPEAFLPTGHEWAGHWASNPWNWEQLPPERLEAAETVDVVRRAIEDLAAACPRQVIVLRDVEGWTRGRGERAARDHRQQPTSSASTVRSARVRRAVEAHLAATET